MEKKVSVEGNFTKVINFAMQQNYVPVVRNLVVHNEAEEKIENVDIKLTFEPEFAKEFTYHIAEIAGGGSVEISPVKLQMKTEYLFSLTERILGTVLVEVFCGEEKLHSFHEEIEILAVDQWSGSKIMPEIVAAFVTPNHPKLVEVIHNAADILQRWTGSTSFTGYLTQNPNNVKLQMAAIYTALQMQGINYNVHPASFETVGQRVRMPHTVLEQKQGNCLDLSILYAACLEAVGLYPLIFFTENHAFAGCWLEKETFADCMVDDLSAIEKRTVVGAEEMLLVECTDYVSEKSVEFDMASKRGKDQLLKKEAFQSVIDIRRARNGGIRPIPLRLEQAYTENNGIAEGEKEQVSYTAPAQLDSSLLGKVAESNEPLTKQKLWERKLLDFSLRNTLLNFRVTKNSVQLMTADLSELEDKLSEGQDFRIMEVPSEWTTTLRDAKMYEVENDRKLIQSIATEEFQNRRIRTFLNETELDKNLKNLYRAAKTSMEENGTNTLYLALAFLRWYESDLSEKARYAPIVLIPVDIVRNVRNKGYVLRSRQEETQINVTLLEYLKQDHGISITGLDPLPEDEHGVDLPLVFNTVRQAIMGKKRWNIEEMAFVGLFSFGQFVMWNDIRNRSDELAQNKVVSSLIQGTLTWEPKEQTITADNLDAEISLKDMAIPMSADSSQMVAIAAAAGGQSFVLHGPPGTGKSQTITNMIANALYQGKSVLFVAEKMAALNVVQKRLAGIGLDPFCLELHSNKTNKASVLAELNKSLEVGKIKSPEEHEATIEKVHNLRSKLNYVIEALHCKREYGSSLYEAVEFYEKNAEHKGKISFGKEKLAAITGDTIAQWNELIRQYVVVTQEIGEYVSHPFAGYEGTEYSIELRESLQAELGRLIAGYDEAAAHLQAIYEWAGCTENKSKAVVETLLQTIDAALLPAVTLTGIICSQNYDAIVLRIRQLIQTGVEYNQLISQIQSQFENSVFDYQAENAKLQWKQAESSWFLPKAVNQNKLVKELKLYAKNPGAVTKATILTYYELLSLAAAKKKEILETPVELTGLLSGLFMGVTTDWAAVNAALQKADAIRKACSTMPGSTMSGSPMPGSAIQESPMPGSRDILLAAVERVAMEPGLAEHKNAVAAYAQEIRTMKTRYTIDMISQENSTDWLGNTKQLLAGYRDNIIELRNKVSFNQADRQLCQNGLENVSAAYKAGKVTANTLTAAYLCGLYYELTLATISGDERLAEFSGKQYNDMIVQYKEAISKYEQLTIQELVARLSANIPSSGTTSAATSEMGILKKAIKNNGRGMSLRRLFDQIPTLLRKLCPCMLMSPISVAQYIDPSFPKFDLVIFDEASQLPTSEAVGTIARGENVVIVGDPKQLPPTSFFTSNHMDEENSELEDLESVLDDCLAISMPQESLKWHYRSRHESLIAYSNMKYYDNKLYTFPSPKDLVSEVKMVHVDGVYDKGKTKQNKAEAQAIVEEIIRRLKDENLRNDSIGVVTFSSVQQNLIDDMLMEEFRNNPELEEFDRSSKEPIFIKNLENVQGDERDVILFSIGYGPDENGKVSMNFGPLNRDGGWRRLNVAISRARKAMIVYSVLRPEQIDLSRTRSEGVAGLKGFLEFAERGKNVLAQRARTDAKKEDLVVQEIAEEIAGMGYEVKCNIGCSEFKMDIGIVDPENPDTYLLGILLDGENCKEASTARDRFVLQPGVLGGLGWSVIRIWTLDWLDDAQRVKEEIRTAVEAVLSKEEEVKTTEEPEPVQLEFEKIEEAEVADSANEQYASAVLSVQGSANDFYLPETMSKIQRVIAEIIEKEAPISRKLLLHKVLGVWGISRGGSRVETIFATAAARVEKSITGDEDRIFFWRKDQIPEQYAIYRVEDAEGNKRSMDDIPSQEIRNAITEVLREQVSLSETDLVRETAKKFGFSRLGNVIDTSVKYAIHLGVEEGQFIRQSNGKIQENS